MTRTGCTPFHCIWLNSPNALCLACIQSIVIPGNRIKLGYPVKTCSKHPQCSHIQHACWAGFYQYRHPRCIPLWTICFRMRLTSSRADNLAQAFSVLSRWHILHIPFPVAFSKLIPRSSALTHVSHNPKLLHSMQPRHMGHSFEHSPSIVFLLLKCHLMQKFRSIWEHARLHQGLLCLHMHSAPQQRWQWLAPLLPVAVVDRNPMPSALAYILPAPASKIMHCLWASCSIYWKHPLGLHIWHKCWQDYYPPVHPIRTYFIW